MKRILLDLDGVLVDHVSGFLNHHSYSVHYKWKTPGSYSMTENTQLKEKEIWKGVDKNFWMNLPIMDDANQVVKLVKEFTDEIGVMTHYPIDFGMPLKLIPDCILGKLRWLENHFPFLMKNFFMGPTKEFIAGPNLILIDDYDKNVDMFQKHGGHSILVPRIWNRFHKRPTIETVRKHLEELIGV